jgi:hypothetical protein
VAKGVQVLHITGMSAGATGVTYSVISVDKTGNKSEAAASAAITLTADITGPATVTAEAAASHASTEGAITITWTLPGDTDIAKVTIGIDDGATGGAVEGDLVILPRTATSYTWTELDDTATGYVFYINTEDFAGNVGNSGTPAATIAAHPRDTTAPAAVTGTGASTPGSGSTGDLKVDWIASTSPDVKWVRIELYTDSAYSSALGGYIPVTVAVGTTTMTLTDGGNSIGGSQTMHYVRLIAVDFADNESAAFDSNANSKS